MSSEEQPRWRAGRANEGEDTLRIILESLTQQVQHTLDTNEEMRRYLLAQIESVREGSNKQVELLRITLDKNFVTEIRFGEHIETIRREISDVKESVRTASVAVTESIEKLADKQSAQQKSTYARIIAIQATLLAAILSGAIAYAIQFLLHH